MKKRRKRRTFMSITFEIVKFKKPTKDDLSNLHMFNPYGSIQY